jgi:hypothetical protein
MESPMPEPYVDADTCGVPGHYPPNAAELGPRPQDSRLPARPRFQEEGLALQAVGTRQPHAKLPPAAA